MIFPLKLITISCDMATGAGRQLSLRSDWQKPEWVHGWKLHGMNHFMSPKLKRVSPIRPCRCRAGAAKSIDAPIGHFESHAVGGQRHGSGMPAAITAAPGHLELDTCGEELPGVVEDGALIDGPLQQARLG